MITDRVFGSIDGTEVRAYEVRTDGTLRAELIDYGARLTRLLVPDRDRVPADVVLGFDDLDGYRATQTYAGATVGRYGNRIRDGRFALDGTPIQLDRNEGSNHLHGGSNGFDTKVWRTEYDPNGTSLRFGLSVPEGDMGYPGACEITSTYDFSGAGTVGILMEVEVSRSTVVNLVHHSYFNLAGHDGGNVLDQLLHIDADCYTPVDEELLTTGEVLLVDGTPFDFRDARRIGERIDELPTVGAQIFDAGGGYDHNWCLRGALQSLRDCVTVVEPRSGRRLRLRTTEPGVQIYTGGYLNGTEVGKGGHAYDAYAGFTLETQKFPDSPNHAQFPSCRVEPAVPYRHEMQLTFDSAPERQSEAVESGKRLDGHA